MILRKVIRTAESDLSLDLPQFGKRLRIEAHIPFQSVSSSCQSCSSCHSDGAIFIPRKCRRLSLSGKKQAANDRIDRMNRIKRKAPCRAAGGSMPLRLRPGVRLGWVAGVDQWKAPGNTPAWHRLPAFMLFWHSLKRLFFVFDPFQPDRLCHQHKGRPKTDVRCHAGLRNSWDFAHRIWNNAHRTQCSDART